MILYNTKKLKRALRMYAYRQAYYSSPVQTMLTEVAGTAPMKQVKLLTKRLREVHVSNFEVRQKS